jgi:hypothetical protein
MMKLLNHKPEAAEKMMLGNGVPLFSAKKGSRAYLGDSAMLGNVRMSLKKYAEYM